VKECQFVAVVRTYFSSPTTRRRTSDLRYADQAVPIWNAQKCRNPAKTEGSPPLGGNSRRRRCWLDAAAIKGGTFEDLTAAGTASMRQRRGLHQQAEGLKTTTARAHCRLRPTIVETRYLRRLRNNPSDATYLLNQYATPTNVSRKEFDGAVAMNRQVKRIVRTLEVKAAQEHMRIITGKPFVAAPSELNGLMYSGLFALHKMRTRWVRRPRSRPARPGCAAKG
jgi:hypothetical protein